MDDRSLKPPGHSLVPLWQASMRACSTTPAGSGLTIVALIRSSTITPVMSRQELGTSIDTEKHVLSCREANQRVCSPWAQAPRPSRPSRHHRDPPSARRGHCSAGTGGRRCGHRGPATAGPRVRISTAPRLQDKQACQKLAPRGCSPWWAAARGRGRLPAIAACFRRCIQTCSQRGGRGGPLADEEHLDTLRVVDTALELRARPTIAVVSGGRKTT